MTTAIAETTDIDAMRASLDGDTLTPASPGYDDARTVWNGMIDRRPAVAIRARTIADVRWAIAFAREEALPLSIKGGGHNVAGHAIADGGVLLDLSGMRGVSVDPTARTASVQGGATWADLDRATASYGLATTGGAISSTGVAGLTLGGGIGWLVGTHGMSIDNLRSVELVTAEGDLVTASASEHPELYWALRGGGGNFGVATSLEFDLHPLDLVIAGKIAYLASDAHDVLAFYREVTATAPDELTIYCSLLPDRETGTRLIAFVLCWSGELRAGERAIERLSRFGSPVARAVGPMPYVEWQRALDPVFPHGRRYYWKGALMTGLSDNTLDALADQAAYPPLPLLNATIEFYAGAMNRVGPSETAFVHRAAKYQVLAIGAWDDPADDERGRGWARRLQASLAPDAMTGAFLNFNSEDGDRVRASYGANWDRLVSVKRRWDPTNVFRCNNNIDPAG